jgi:hypothetical protein
LSSSCHSKSNISSLHGWCIISTITSDSDNITKLSESSNHDILISWLRSSQHFQILTYKFHVCKVSNHFSILVFTNDLNWLLSLNIDYTSNIFIEIFTSHANLWVQFFFSFTNDATFLGNGNSSNLVITSNHSDSYTSNLALFNGAWHLFSDDILDTNNTNQNHLLLLDVVDLITFFLFFMVWSSVTFFEVFVSESNTSQSF